MQPGDTITAPASGWGAGHRSLVRLSGPGVPGVLAACFHPAILMPAAPCVTRARFLIRPAEASSRSLPLLPLPLLVLVYPAPRSYTGEHAAELLLPGSPALMERVLATLMAHPGVREASPGEFTARAYLAGKMTLAQAEGVAATIASRNSDELAAARSVLDGSAGARLRGWCDELASLLALVEAGIDFTDQEDVVPIAPPVLLAALARLRSEMDAYLGHAQGDEARTDAPVVVLAGRPNAGKSTLFNALLGRRRAVVSPLEGTTRDLLVEDLDLSDDVPGGPVVRLTDLAGIDDAILPPLPSAIPARIDVDAQHRARVAIAQADVVVLCDPTGRFTSVPPLSDLTRLIRLRTKADLPVDPARSGDPAAARDSALAVCALDGWNLGPLRRAIADAASQDRRSGGVAVLPRHHRCVATALAAIDRAAASLKGAAGPQPPGAPPPRAIASPELVADSLRAALDELGSLAGRISPDDVIGRIFATFCIGK